MNKIITFQELTASTKFNFSVEDVRKCINLYRSGEANYRIEVIGNHNGHNYPSGKLDSKRLLQTPSINFRDKSLNGLYIGGNNIRFEDIAINFPAKKIHEVFALFDKKLKVLSGNEAVAYYTDILKTLFSDKEEILIVAPEEETLENIDAVIIEELLNRFN